MAGATFALNASITFGGNELAERDAHGRVTKLQCRMTDQNVVCKDFEQRHVSLWSPTAHITAFPDRSPAAA
jgi:hypothetical protein